MTKKKLDKETKQIIMIGIITIVLMIIAVFVYIRNSKSEEVIEEPEEIEEVKEITFTNVSCDKDYMPSSLYKNYTDYIVITALDNNGCVLENTPINSEYILMKSDEARDVAMAMEEKFNYNLPDATSIRTDQITIKNDKGNILGWTLLLFYSNGVNSSRWALNSNEEWIQIG